MAEHTQQLKDFGDKIVAWCSAEARSEIDRVRDAAQQEKDDLLSEHDNLLSTVADLENTIMDLQQQVHDLRMAAESAVGGGGPRPAAAPVDPAPVTNATADVYDQAWSQQEVASKMMGKFLANINAADDGCGKCCGWRWLSGTSHDRYRK